MICQTGPRTTYSGSHTQSIKNRNKYDQVPFLRRVHFGVSVWFLTLQKGFWIFAASLGAWFGWYWPKLRHAWRGPFSSSPLTTSPFVTLDVFPGFGRVTLFIAHFQCIWGPRHARFFPFQDHVTLDFFSDLPTPPLLVTREDLWTSPCMQRGILYKGGVRLWIDLIISKIF